METEIGKKKKSNHQMQKTCNGHGHGNDWRRNWRPKYVKHGKWGGNGLGRRSRGRWQGKISSLGSLSAMWPKHWDISVIAEHQCNLRKSHDPIYALQRSDSMEKMISRESRVMSRES